MIFWPDIANLEAFYNHRVGQVACRHIRSAIQERWSGGNGEQILGIGYSFPYLRGFSAKESQHQLFAMLPASLGMRAWPSQQPSRSFVCHENEIPLASESMNRVLMVHALEYSDDVPGLLSEVFRILVPEGRAMLVIPNRLSLWARAELSPFSSGRPFNIKQIKRLLSDQYLMRIHTDTALFFPPTDSRLILGTAPLWEKIGPMILPHMGGVWLIELEKRVMAFAGGNKQKSPSKSRAYIPVPRPVLQPLVRD